MRTNKKSKAVVIAITDYETTRFEIPLQRSAQDNIHRDDGDETITVVPSFFTIDAGNATGEFNDLVRRNSI
jgi:hypothetical protein